MFSFTLCSCVINVFAKNSGLSGFNVVRRFIHMLLLITFLLQVSLVTHVGKTVMFTSSYKSIECVHL